MTKKFWTSLVLGLTLSVPTLMVGCGEETKTKTTEVESTPGGSTTTTKETKVKSTGENPPANSAGQTVTPAPKAP